MNTCLMAGLTASMILLLPSNLLARAGDLRGWSSVIARNAQSTVLIMMEEPNKPPDFGSGVVIEPSGLVLTARHVLPSAFNLSTGTYDMKGVVGATNAAPDMSRAVGLSPVYVSDRYDLAVLRFNQAPDGLVVASAGRNLKSGDPLLVLGYPGGGGLIATDGLASGSAADGMSATDAMVGRGNSGGPVYNDSGELVGILLQGTRSEADGQIRLGYFRPVEAIVDLLAHDPPGIRISVPATPGLLPTPPSLPVKVLKFNYGVDETKDDHPVVLESHKRDYERFFPALPGYRVTSATFEAQSANHVTSGPTIEILKEGTVVHMSWTLESGPAVDRWRGWLHGTLATSQTYQ